MTEREEVNYISLMCAASGCAFVEDKRTGNQVGMIVVPSGDMSKRDIFG